MFHGKMPMHTQNGQVKDFPRRLNGNGLLVEDSKTKNTPGEMKKSQLVLQRLTVGTVHFPTKIPTKTYSFTRLQSNHSNPTDTVYMIWQEMYGSGVWIGITTITIKP